MHYAKPPLDITAQIDLLKKRGLLFKDEKRAAHHLSNVSYYRLRAYTYPFQDNSDANHPFIKAVTFEDIIELYGFDGKLRLLIFDAIEKIEIALRTKIIYYFSLRDGSHWHEVSSLYINNSRFVRDLSELYKEIDRSTETFIKHYKSKYTSPQYPPSWMSLEVASMGLLSKIFSNLKNCPQKKNVCREFGLIHYSVLESWLHSFCLVRNICAHHGRLWNRRLTLVPMLPDKTLFPYLVNSSIEKNKLYTILSCMTYALQIINPQTDFNHNLKSLLRSCPHINLKEMGFPPDWQNEPLWR